MALTSINPYNGQLLQEHKELSSHEISDKIDDAYVCFCQWKDFPMEQRTKLLRSAAGVLRKNIDKYSETITLEMGKCISESRAEILKCAIVCEYYAKHANEFLKPETLITPHGHAYLEYNPLGVVLAVMPWNFPFWQVFRFAAPALMAGNTCMLKHASNVSLCALEIEEVFREAGSPEHAFTTLLISSGKVASVIEHPQVKAVTLTGSEYAGRSVASLAGNCIKKSVLELGGSDPFIVLSDADIDEAANSAVKARMMNTGQSCIAAKRFIIHHSIREQFTQVFINSLSSLVEGDPMMPETTFSILADQRFGEELKRQVENSLKMGARLIYGKMPSTIDSAYFPPIILENLQKGMPAFDEELFGPVACFYYFDRDDEAIGIANDCDFGLGASIWTKDLDRGQKLASKIESGSVYINQMMFSDPAIPFGGVKNSGYGRELSHLGIREFTNQKSVWIS